MSLLPPDERMLTGLVSIRSPLGGHKGFVSAQNKHLHAIRTLLEIYTTIPCDKNLSF